MLKIALFILQDTTPQENAAKGDMEAAETVNISPREVLERLYTARVRKQIVHPGCQ